MKKWCIDCELGCTMETSHEWIETCCDYQDWHSAFTEACEHFVEKQTKEKKDNEHI